MSDGLDEALDRLLEGWGETVTLRVNVDSDSDSFPFILRAKTPGGTAQVRAFYDFLSRYAGGQPASLELLNRLADEQLARTGSPTGDWRAETWRARALLLATLYFTLTAAAEFEFKGDILNKLEAHLVAALAIWGYFAERNRRKAG